MTHARRFPEIDDLAAFDAAIGRRSGLRGAIVQSVDLTSRTDALATTRVTGAVFLGCEISEQAEDSVRERGALVFPPIRAVPIDPYRGTLYSAAELYNEPTYAHSLDARVYAWSRGVAATQVAGSLGTALHDHAISNALDEALAPIPRNRRVGIMGGHALDRGTDGYREAAELARAITRAGAIVLTGGGPGAMEAANLGASFAQYDDDELPAAIEILAQAPRFSPDIDAWVSTAREVLERWPLHARSVGIPTWFYGHEPPNLFATDIAKYFANPIREATLLERCGGGIVYLAGAAGTVQEIFADACENYYAPDDHVAPMVLLGREHWTKTLPAWPLVEALGTNREMGRKLHLVDDAEDVLPALGL